MSETLKEQAFNSMQWTGISTVYVSVVQLFNIFVLAFFLSPFEIGSMTILMLTIWFTQAFSDGGMSPAIVHHKHIDPYLLNSLFLLNIVYSVVLYVVLNLISAPLSVLFKQPDLQSFFPLAMSVVVTASIGTQFRVIMTKLLRFDLIARHEMASVTVNALVAITLASQGYGVWSMVIGYVCGSVVSTGVLLYYGLQYWKPGLKFTASGLSEYVRFGQFQIGERVLIFLNSRMDQILVGALLGTQALGIYTIAHNFVISPTIRVNQVITTVMFPVFARLQEELEILRNGYLKLVKIVTILNTPILLGMALVAPFVIPLLFDPKWHESIYIIQILSVYALIRSTGSPAGSLQLAKGRADLGFKWNLGLLIISGPVIFAGIQWGGLTGMGWSLILLHAFLMIPYWIFMIRPLIGPPARSYFYAILDAFVPGIFMAASVWVLSLLPYYPSDTIKLWVLISSGVGLFTVFIYNVERVLFLEVKTLIVQKYLRK
jgi:lipopolysaccharide exporter